MLRILSLVVVSFSMLWIAAPASAQNAYTPDVAEFDGSNSYAFPKNPSLNLTGGATIEFWVQCDWKTDPGYDPVVISNAGSKGALYTISILGDRSGLSLQAGDKIGSVPFDFKGNHMNYVAIADFSDGAAILVNGRVVGTLDFGFADLASGGFWVGSADGTTAPFKGAIAGLRLWGVALDRSDLVKYSTMDVPSSGVQHPEIDALIAKSDFENSTLEIFSEEITPNKPKL